MKIFELSKDFPPEEKYSLTDQIRRASRSVCGNTAEGFRKRKYPKAFVVKLSDAEGEAAETINWLDFSLACKYISKKDHNSLCKTYDHINWKISEYVPSNLKTGHFDLHSLSLSLPHSITLSQINLPQSEMLSSPSGFAAGRWPADAKTASFLKFE